MRYAQIRSMDISDGEGIGVSLYVQGCLLHCKDCFNQSTWDFSEGKDFTKKVEAKFLDLCGRDYIDHVSILGGEPLDERNIEDVQSLVLKINKPIWLWTGKETDEWNKLTLEYPSLFHKLSYIVDGHFDYTKRDLTLAFRGSSNQRIWHNERSDTQEVASDKWVDVTEYFDTKGV